MASVRKAQNSLRGQKLYEVCASFIRSQSVQHRIGRRSTDQSNRKQILTKPGACFLFLFRVCFGFGMVDIKANRGICRGDPTKPRADTKLLISMLPGQCFSNSRASFVFYIDQRKVIIDFMLKLSGSNQEFHRRSKLGLKTPCLDI